MGSGTELKFREFATKRDAVALLPTSHDCEDEECNKSCNSVCCRICTCAPIGTTHAQFFVFRPGKLDLLFHISARFL